MFHFTLEEGGSILTMVAVAIVAVGLTGWLYRRVYRHLTHRQWVLLLALRVAAVLLVILLLFRPVISLQAEIVQKRSVIFLVDTSSSMAATDDASGQSRFEQARGRVEAWWKPLGQHFDLHLLEFSDRATLLKGPEELTSRQPTGPATSLTQAILAAAQKMPRRDVEAVVLLSDGIHDVAGDPVLIARKQGLMIHAVGVGNSLRDSPSYRDVQVIGLECPPQMVVNNKARITASIDSVGMAGRVVKVVLEEDGKSTGETELTLASGAAPQEVAFQFLPTVKGRHTYQVRVPTLAEEKVPQNNQRSAFSQVIDARIRVLYLEGALRGEYGAIVDRFLSRDPDVEFCALVQTRRNVFVQRTNMAGLKLNAIPSDPAVLEKFNVFVIGDLDSSHLKPEQVDLLVKRVREGAGLVMLGGYNSLGPGGYAGTGLEEILPVSLGGRDVGQVTDPFLPRLTPEGRTHPLFTNIAKFFPTQAADAEVAGLPPLLGCVKVKGSKPGASVLAVHPVEGAMPVLAVQPVGKGRTAVFTADTTRNWHQTLKALDQETPFLRFWGQVVRWLANRGEEVKTEASVTAAADKAAYEPEATVTITAVVRGKDGEGQSQARVTAQVNLGGTATDLAVMTATAPTGTYRATFVPKRAGTYEVLVEAKVGDTSLKADELTFEVGRPNLEYERLDLDDKLLARIASATGGSYFHVSTADRLVEELNRRELRRRVELEQPLYWPPLFWLGVVGLLGTEWFLRKRYQLR